MMSYDKQISLILSLIITRINDVNPEDTVKLRDGTIANRKEALCGFLLQTIDEEIDAWHEIM